MRSNGDRFLASNDLSAAPKEFKDYDIKGLRQLAKKLQEIDREHARLSLDNNAAS